MNWEYKDLVGKEITLVSRQRTYRFQCTNKEKLNAYNLKLLGTGPEPDPLFLQYSTIEINGQQLGTSVKAVKDANGAHYNIETETLVTDSDFWAKA